MRLLRWLLARLRAASAVAGYWGGIVMADLRRFREVAANFLHRR